MGLSDKQLQHLMTLAKTESLKSHCFRARVGALIVNSAGDILSTGYNAPPPGLPTSKDAGFCNKDKHGFKSGEGYHVCRSIHAEHRAILELGIHNTEGHIMLVFGHQFVCAQCRLVILLAKIRSVILQSSSEGTYKKYDPKDWQEEIRGFS